MYEDEKVFGVRYAQRLVERAISEMEQYLRPGITERQAAARLKELCANIPGVEQALTDMVISGPNSAE